MRKNNIRRWCALTLALLMVVTLALGCVNKDDQAMDVSVDSQASMPPPPDQSEESTASANEYAQPDVPDELLTQYQMDVACVPKQAAQQAGTNQPDPAEPPPDTMPPPTDIPSLDTMSKDPEESDAELEAAPEGTISAEDEALNEEAEKKADKTATSREEIEKIKDSSVTKKDSKLKKNADETLKGDKPISCKKDGDFKGADPGPPSDRTEDGEAGETGELGFVESLFVDTAQAQTSCQPIAIVKAGTRATDAELRSLTGAVDLQLYNNFSSTWWCAYAYYAPNTNSVGTGSWPIYITSGTNAPGRSPGNWHDWGYWPYYPFTYSPYAQVPDGTSGYGTSGTPNYNYWAQAVSHEAIETLSDPYTRYDPTTNQRTGWFSTGPGAPVGLSGNADYAWEAADIVWDGSSLKSYGVNSTYDGRRWMLTDFALRSFFGGSPPYSYKEKFLGINNVKGVWWGKCDGPFIIGKAPAGVTFGGWFQRSYVC